MKYITRFAPSPTGNPHVGNIRTALFDYLAAKSTGGKFYLRIEDTDRERFVPDAVKYIHEALDWLGLKYDGEVVYQSERLPVYQKRAQELLNKGLAYRCYCSKERLEKLRRDQEVAGKPPIYDRHCLNLSKEEIEENEKRKIPYVVRFKIPEKVKTITWNDKVRGKIEFSSDTLEDFIILKSDRWPTYNLAHIIDDHETEISLVIRGEEFVPSTPKYILVHEAFGWQHPEYAHMPLTIGKDGKKLSKRHGDTAILDYKKKGYLPEAMLNFLVLLGWNPGEGSTDEIFTKTDLEKKFSIDRVGKAPAVFDLDRLNWMNGVYIRNLSVKELTARIINFDSKFAKINKEFLEKVVKVEQSRLKTLAEFAEISQFYFNLLKYDPNTLIFKKSSLETTRRGLESSLGVLKETKWSRIENFEEILAKIVTDNELNNADVYWPIRVALSGQEKSPSPAELLWVLGKEESCERLGKALRSLK